MGGYYFKMRPHTIDAVVLSGGIGENRVELHDALLKRFQGTPLGLLVAPTAGPATTSSDTVHEIGTYPAYAATTGQGVRWLICQVSGGVFSTTVNSTLR